MAIRPAPLVKILGAVAALVILWGVLGIPPVGLVLKYGFPRSRRATGRTLEVEGLAFVEVQAGYCRRTHECDHPSSLERLASLVGLEWGRAGAEHCPPRWIEVDRSFWIASPDRDWRRIVEAADARMTRSLRRALLEADMLLGTPSPDEVEFALLTGGFGEFGKAFALDNPGVVESYRRQTFAHLACTFAGDRRLEPLASR